MPIKSTGNNCWTGNDPQPSYPVSSPPALGPCCETRRQTAVGALAAPGGETRDEPNGARAFTLGSPRGAALAIAAALGSAARAQNVADSAAGAPAVQRAPAASTAAEAPLPAAVGEVVVTAQRRSENVQKVPVAVSVVSAAALQTAAIFNAESLQQVVPSLSFKKGTKQRQLDAGDPRHRHPVVRVRRRAQRVHGGGRGGSTVARARHSREFSDLDHIEVAARAAGHAVRQERQRRPDQHHQQGRLPSSSRATSRPATSRAAEVRANADVSGPITDRIAYRLSGVYGDYRGNIYNYGADKFTNGYHRLGARGSIVARRDRTICAWTLRADYTHATDNCCADVLGTFIPNAQFNSVFLPLLKPTTPGQTNETVNNDTSPPHHRRQRRGIGPDRLQAERLHAHLDQRLAATGATSRCATATSATPSATSSPPPRAGRNGRQHEPAAGRRGRVELQPVQPGVPHHLALDRQACSTWRARSYGTPPKATRSSGRTRSAPPRPCL